MIKRHGGTFDSRAWELHKYERMRVKRLWPPIADSQLIRAELNAGQSELCLKHSETAIHHSACRSYS